MGVSCRVCTFLHQTQVSKKKVRVRKSFCSQLSANDFSVFYKYDQETLGDIKAPRHLIIEQRVVGGWSDGAADSWLLLLRNNDASKTNSSAHGTSERFVLRRES